jgi:tRNA nucleotidyltransferase/poly(A) polymerase
MRIKKKNILFEERIKSNLSVPNEIKQLHSLFQKNGNKLFIVGGAVRDTLLGKPIKDYDLATDLPAPEVAKLLDANNIRNIGTGVKFGVINAFINNEEYEIATFREDVGKGRRPDSVIFSDIETDVKRRDLTINALFYDIATKEIVDLVGGMEDIKNGVVRTVGDAGERFGEDRLRILRAVRFAARIGSKLDPAIDKALRQDNSLKGISGERIMDEFIKGIKSAKSTKHFLSLLDTYNLFDWIFNGITPINKNFVESNDVIVVISILLKAVSYDTINKMLNELKYSSKQIKQIVFLTAFNQVFSESAFYTLKKMHRKSGVDSHRFLEFAEEMNIDISLVRKFINFNFSITGDFVKEKFGMKDGPELGAKIKELETQLFLSK